MPEAVDSSTTRAPDSQAQRTAIRVADKFEDLRDMLEAFNVMTCAALDDQAGYPDNFSNGVTLLHKLVMEELGKIRSEVIDLVEGETRFLKETDMDVIERVGRMVADAYCEAGWDMEWDRQLDWSKEVSREYVSTAARCMKELKGKLEGDTHLLTVGSLLPWLEMKLRRELGLSMDFDHPLLPDDIYADPSDLRAAFIVEKVKEGFSLAHISQALNIKKANIERVIGRLQVDSPKRKAI